MPSKYAKKPGPRRYRDYDEQTLLQAIKDCKSDSVKKVAERCGIPFRTLWNKVKGLHQNSCGGQTALRKEVEDELVNCFLICSEFGMPLEQRDVKLVVSGNLNRTQQKITVFKNNVPGDDWVRGFLKRNDILTNRMCQNIKRSRAQVQPENVEKYFSNLKGSLEGVPTGNIVNYDETNLADDPGVTKCIFRRGVKYPERVINHSKGNISIIFSGTAEGELLPPFVVYKAAHLYDSWRQGGPTGTRFGRSKSGWFDAANFEEWFSVIIVPWARRREGPKLMIGDNLSSHLSEAVISKCQELDIRFVLLPPNSTDKCQPLDVSFFGPMKREWKQIMKEHKMQRPSSTSLDKALFPRLLSKLMERMGIRIPANLKAGFRACGIAPFNMDVVLRKFPRAGGTTERTRTAQLSPALLEYLQQFKYNPGGNQKQRTARKRLLVEPGKSISGQDLASTSSSSSSSTPSALPDATGTSSSMTSTDSAHASTSSSSSDRRKLQSQTQTPVLSDSASESSDSEVVSSEDEWQPSVTKKARCRNVFQDLS